MFRHRLSLIAAVCLLASAAPALAQNTVTLTPSVTQGNGSITTDLTWSTNPALTTGTPCVASGHPSWTGPKAGSGSQTGIVISTSGTLNLVLTCTFPGDSIVTFTWTPPTQNTDGTNYANPKDVRIKYTFNATLTPGPSCGTGETCVDVPVPQVMRTVTGISSTGTLRAAGFARNLLDVFSDASNVATKSFQGNVPVTQSVAITVNPKPQPLTGFGAN